MPLFSPPPLPHPLLSPQENINRLADEAEAELAARRAAIEAGRADLEAFEADTAAARSEGLFFGGLYRGPPAGEASTAAATPAGEPAGDRGGSSDAAARMRAALARLPGDVADASAGGGGGGGGAGAAPAGAATPGADEAAADPAAAIVAAASAEVGSSLRYGVWLVLCIACGGVAVIDLFSVAPAFPADAAALGLAALLGWSAAREAAAVEAAARAVEARARRRRGEEE